MSTFDFCALVVAGIFLYCRHSVAAQADRYREFMGELEPHSDDTLTTDEPTPDTK